MTDSVAQFDDFHNTDYPGGPDADTLLPIIQTHEQHGLKAGTAEIAVGRRHGDRMVSLT